MKANKLIVSGRAAGKSTFIKYEQCIKDIEKILKEVCQEECDFKWCKGKNTCGDSDCRFMQIMSKVKIATESEA